MIDHLSLQHLRGGTERVKSKVHKRKSYYINKCKYPNWVIMGLWIQSTLSNAHSTMAYVLKLGLTTAQLVFSPKDSALDITRCCSSGCNEAPPKFKMRSCLAHGFHLKQQVWYGSNIIYHIICSRPHGVVICYWWCCRLYHSQICATAHGLRIALTPPHHTHKRAPWLSNRGFPIRKTSSISTVAIFSRDQLHLHRCHLQQACWEWPWPSPWLWPSAGPGLLNDA